MKCAIKLRALFNVHMTEIVFHENVLSENKGKDGSNKTCLKQVSRLRDKEWSFLKNFYQQKLDRE
jgi:hypothetical protein